MIEKAGRRTEPLAAFISPVGKIADVPPAVHTLSARHRLILSPPRMDFHCIVQLMLLKGTAALARTSAERYALDNV